MHKNGLRKYRLKLEGIDSQTTVAWKNKELVVINKES